jgi:hypothetical protein
VSKRPTKATKAAVETVVAFLALATLAGLREALEGGGE